MCRPRPLPCSHTPGRSTAGICWAKESSNSDFQLSMISGFWLQIVWFCYLKWINNSFRNPELKKGLTWSVAEGPRAWSLMPVRSFDGSKPTDFGTITTLTYLLHSLAFSNTFLCVCGSGNTAAICQYGATTNKFVSLFYFIHLNAPVFYPVLAIWYDIGCLPVVFYLV